MNGFVNWDSLLEFSYFVTTVFTVVEFTKSLPLVKRIPTKYWSAAVAFILLILVNMHSGTFNLWDILIYGLSAILISLSANGLSNFNKKMGE